MYIVLLQSTCFLYVGFTKYDVLRGFYFGDPRSQKQQSGQAKPMKSLEKYSRGFYDGRCSNLLGFRCKLGMPTGECTAEDGSHVSSQNVVNYEYAQSAY